MPEKPKRRKNKNKRKNNRNVTDSNVNKNNNKESGTTIDESLSSVTEEIPNENIEEEQTKVIAVAEITSSSSGACENSISQLTEDNVCAERCNEDNNILLKEENSEFEKFKESNKVTLDFTEECPDIAQSSLKETSCQNNEEDNKLTLSVDACDITKQIEEVQQSYIVEVPETKTKCKLDNGMKSKSCDNDDCPTIVEVIEDSVVENDNDNSISVIDNNNVIITGEESDVEWEKVDHFNLPQTELIKGILSSDTIPLNIVHCEQIKSLSPQEELSLRNYLQTLNLSTNSTNFDADIKTEIEQIINREIKYRLRKKGQAEDNLFTRAGPSRSLAVIDEEGSGDSSKTSRRHSYLSDKRSDNEELEDDVFESKPTHLSESSNITYIPDIRNKRLIPQPCIRVDAKLKEPEISEARGNWSMQTVEKMTGAELVYLTDSSSSTSSIYDINDDIDKGEETDVSVRMITPTIEVTDTESLLSNTFLSNNNKKNVNEPCDNEEISLSDKPNLNNNKTEEKEFNNMQTDPNLQNDPHEIVILSTDEIKTNLFVKDINELTCSNPEQLFHNNIANVCSFEKLPACCSKAPEDVDKYDLEIKVLKCELNDAINNLIKEVISDSENAKESSKDQLARQDSSSSVDSSQCTAKYNPTSSSLNDVSNILQDDISDNINKESLQMSTTSSHVKEVLQCVITKPPLIPKRIEDEHRKQPSTLKDTCLKKISSFPFGDKILEELAHVSLRLQNMSALASDRSQEIKNQPSEKDTEVQNNQCELNMLSNYKTSSLNENNHVPPPIQPRKSSLKLVQDEQIKYVTPKIETVYQCLSPSQKMLMEKTNTTINKDFKSQPNVNIIPVKISNSNDNKSNHEIISTPMSPMKSETGSRLLALLRDTSISKKLNTNSLESKNELKIKAHESFSKRLLNEIDSAKYFTETTSYNESFSTFSPNKFKPIPPPKPRKISNFSYESDESSNFQENSFRTMHSNKKYFHYSTGNLNKEIENDISSIQNMHRYCTNLRDESYQPRPRRPSLPKDLCDQQMEYIRQKEKEVDAELRRLEREQNKPNIKRGPRAPMVLDETNYYDSQTKSYVDKDLSVEAAKNVGNSKLSSLFSSSQEELLREKMYTEYINQMAEREQRKQQKIIKVTQTPVNISAISKSMPILENFDSKMNNRIEQEFITKARERWCKLGIRDPETEDEKDSGSDFYTEPKVIEHKIKVIETGEEKDVKNLPSHMQEFVKFTVKDKEENTGSAGESDSEKASTHVVIFCAVVILVLTVGKFLLQLLRNK